MLDLTISSDVLARTNPHNPEYSHFSLNINIGANLLCAAKASTPGITSAD